MSQALLARRANRATEKLGPLAVEPVSDIAVLGALTAANPKRAWLRRQLAGLKRKEA